MFDDMVVSGQIKNSSKPWTVVVSSIGQAFLLGILILIPLISYSELPKSFNATYLAAPLPPRPAPAPPPFREYQQRPRSIPINNLQAPNHIPTHAVMIAEPASAVDFSGRGIAGVSGDPGLLADLIGAGASAPPPPSKATARIRVVSVVQAARLIHQTLPVYPRMGVIAHVQGTVVLHAIIGKDGSITSLQYVSGPTLLMKAAEDAVSTWRYQPLVLNGETTEVETEISVVFTLNE